MKPTTLEGVGSHGEAIYRGWTKPAGADEGPQYFDLQNDSGVDLLEGDPVVVISDGTIAKTTTVADERPTGICLDDIDYGDSGPVQFLGPVDLINVTASVTAGNFGRTSTSGLVEEIPTAEGAFVYFTSSGIEPEGFVLAPSAANPAGGGGGSSSGGMVPYYIPVDETFTVPLYKQGLWAEPIEVDGALVVNGILMGVD